MCFDAHLPNAAEPPDLFISDTIAPRITRNIRIPMLYESAIDVIKPSTNRWSIVPVKLKPE
jgi:hypothetical protein